MGNQGLLASGELVFPFQRRSLRQQSLGHRLVAGKEYQRSNSSKSTSVALYLVACGFFFPKNTCQEIQSIEISSSIPLTLGQWEWFR